MMLPNRGLLRSVRKSALICSASMLFAASMSAQAALTPQDQTDLTASLQSLSTGWVQSDVNRANDILSNSAYTTSDYSTFFSSYFTGNSLNNALIEYLQYPVFYWFDEPVHLKLQTALVQTLPSKINSLVAAHPSDLAVYLNNNTNALQSLSNFHKIINMTLKGTLISSTNRQNLASFYAQHLIDYPQYWDGQVTFNTATQPYLAALRGQVFNNLARSLPLTSARKNTVAQQLGLSGLKAQIWQNHGVIITDNNWLDSTQLSVVSALLNSVPAGLQDLSSISINTKIGNADANGQSIIQLTTFSAVNIFEYRVGSIVENQFPNDVTAYSVDLFGSAMAHELNHIVAAYSIYPVPARQARQDALIAQAGANHMNYLRSNAPDGFFIDAPQEFFASMSNQWTANTEKMLQLALTRWQAGYREPINQFLFFAEVYAQGGSQIPFYVGDTGGNYQTQMVNVQRNANGFISSMTVNGEAHEFVVDTQGNVSDIPALAYCQEYTSTVSAHVTSNRAVKRTTGSWFYAKSEYFTVGSNQSLGTSSTATKTLKEDPQGYYSLGTCPVAPAAPVINSVSAATATKVSESGGNVSFDVRVTGTVSDVNDDLQDVTMTYNSVSTSCGNGSNYNCILRITVPAASLPMNIDNVAYLVASDYSGLSSPRTYIAHIRLENVSALACYTAANSAHASAGRATLKYSVLYYAVGTNTYLGTSATSTSLQETAAGSGQWKKVTNCP